MTHKLFLGIFLILSTLGFSQLNRKSQFGARVEFVNENGNSGCKVIQVTRGTSLALKLQEKDLILKIGENTFQTVDEFIKYFLKYSIFFWVSCFRTRT